MVPGSHRSETIGGMIATYAAGLHAVCYGRMMDWVAETAVVDGIGHIHTLPVSRCEWAPCSGLITQVGDFHRFELIGQENVCFDFQEDISYFEVV